ncbi:MAG: hypothetical protein JWM26_4735 [Betaproteobacteria bacterium]|nr:hypothetical protein [Betaproteobacteria bacterium]
MKKLPRILAIVFVTAVGMGNAMGETVNFDAFSPGALPTEWACGVTGSGSSRWTVEPAADAPSKPNVVKQSGVGDFPWCALKGASLADGYVEVKFKALSGRSDQAGGVMWRWKDGNNYYVARANALENNVSLYYTTNGRRNTIKYVDAPVPRNQWHTLRVEFAGTSMKVSLNGKTYIDVQDKRIAGAGAVGLWTKADSVTAFDDFAYGAAAQPK